MAKQTYDNYYQPPPPVPVPVTEYHASNVYDNGAINTLFISGLPDDVKAREIHNLFRRRPGFDSCQLKYTGRGNQVVAFATFFNHQSAIAAMHSMDGVTFDPQSGSTLHIELARSNSRRKRRPGSGPYVVIDHRPKETSNERVASSNDGEDKSEEEDPSEGENSSEEEDGNSGGNGDVAKRGETAGNESAVAGDDSAPAAANSEKAVDEEPKPCSTLFLANLGPNCTEDELKQAFSQHPGFTALRMRAKGGIPVAFADFEEIEQATKAMDELQGMPLASSDRGGMNIEYLPTLFSGSVIDR